jgi:hypothetical protein
VRPVGLTAAQSPLHHEIAEFAPVVVIVDDAVPVPDVVPFVAGVPANVAFDHRSTVIDRNPVAPATETVIDVAAAVVAVHSHAHTLLPVLGPVFRDVYAFV